MIIDAHHHFWDPERAEYGWMTGPAAPLKRRYAPEHLLPEMALAGVGGSLLVQTRSSLEETREFLALAGACKSILGVVGWVDLTSPDVGRQIADLMSGPHGHLLVGIRHQVHDEADADWLLRDDVQRGLAAVQAAGLSYDLLVRSRELPAAIAVVERFPGLRFVIDHLAKPEIGKGVLEPWASLIGQLSKQRAHVWCKLSGMVTEADFATWRTADFQPYVRTVVEAFGADRCMYGSDWPVCTLAASYGTTLEIVGELIAGLSREEKAHVWSGSASAAYRLDIPGKDRGNPPASVS